MINQTIFDVLDTAYLNDYVDTLDFNIKILNKCFKNGLLTNRHIRDKRVIFWISEKGLKVYEGLK